MHTGLAPEEYAGLKRSGLFDEAFYRTQISLPRAADALRHYLELGWQWGLRPHPDFESAFVQPFYEAAGLEGPPLLHWLELSARGGRLPCTRGEAEWRADRLRHSPAFDAAFYATRLPPGIDPVLHYVLVGEALGWRPSALFDPVFYCERHPDVPAIGFSPLLHFEVAGRQEGRRFRPAVDRLDFPVIPPSGRPVVIMLVHEASRTGAPVLGWSLASRLAERFDVITMVMKGGEMEPDFAKVSAAVVGPMVWEEWHPAEMSRVAERLVETYRPRFAVCNSIETNLLVPPLAVRGVPSVALVHEFAAYTRPLEKMSNVFDWATDIVFPARIVARSSFRNFTHLGRRRGVHIMAQGRVDPPTGGEDGRTPGSVLEKLRPTDAADAFVVLGAGTVQIRKGVDVFFAVAAAVRRMAPELDIRFAWVGDGYDPVKDPLYSAYLAEQYDASGLENVVTMLPSVPDLDPVYAASDAFLLSS
ncbi:MAG TPA: glycosyltransferase, partial [Acetobacteraceae bacterium]|nr:glycosyltransferase [Acetobacteraceae bacterium]